MRRFPKTKLFLGFIILFSTVCQGNAVVKLNGGKAVTVPVGARMILDAYTWGSVGLEARCEVGSPMVVKLVRSDVLYDYFTDAGKGMLGSDEGRGGGRPVQIISVTVK